MFHRPSSTSQGRPAIRCWHSACSETREVRSADCVAVLPQQATLRRSGHLPAPPQSRADRARPQRRGVLRPALPRPRRGRLAHQGAEPGPLPRAGPVPRAQAQGVPRPGRRRGVRDHVRGRLPRAQDLQHPGGPAARRSGSTTSTSPTTTRCSATGCSRSRRWGSRSSPRSTTRSPSTVASTSRRPRTRGASSRSAAGTASCGCRSRVARKARKILTPSETSKRDIAKDFGVDPARMQVILLGVDDGFVPPTAPRVPGRIIAMASADAPMKGIATLLEAFAKLRTERDVELILVTSPKPGGRTEQLIDKLSITDSVRFVNGISDAELVELMGSAEIACVPSPLRGLLAADRRADGLRYAADRVAAPARSPRWSARTATRRPGHPRRRRRARGGDGRAPRRPRAPRA